MIRRGRPVVLVLVLALPTLLAACTAPGQETHCDAETIIADGVAGLAALAHPDGGVRPHDGAAPDPRTTAWALLAAGLARRTGHEGAFDPGPHIDHLRAHLDTMRKEGSGVDSAANNMSLARAALQVWGRSANGIPVEDADPEVRTLEDAWTRRYDASTGRYGARLNEHLFGAFSAWIFAPPGVRLAAMADATVDALSNASADPTATDAWWAAYARAALGPTPEEPDAIALAERLEGVLDAHQTSDGGVRGFASASQADASTTAAALLAWQRAGEGLDGARVAPAIAWSCDAQRADGTISFRPDRPILPAKTTAETVIAVALLHTPIPWQDGPES